MKIRQFDPNRIVPSIYIMRELCYFSLDRWEIKIHLLWNVSIYWYIDISRYQEAFRPMRDINTFQCVDILHWRAFLIQDNRRPGLVQMFPWCPCKMSENLTTAGKKEWKFTFERFRENIIDCLYFSKNMSDIRMESFWQKKNRWNCLLYVTRLLCLTRANLTYFSKILFVTKEVGLLKGVPRVSSNIF